MPRLSTMPSSANDNTYPTTTGATHPHLAKPSEARSDNVPETSNPIAPASSNHVMDYSPVNSGLRLANVACTASTRSFDGKNAEFHAAT